MTRHAAVLFHGGSSIIRFGGQDSLLVLPRLKGADSGPSGVENQHEIEAPASEDHPQNNKPELVEEISYYKPVGLDRSGRSAHA
jgi:hypothetical protein